MPNKIKFHIDDNNVAILTLNDPDRLNALSLEMLTEIHEKIKLINSGTTNARCLVITGEGRGFCAGANLIDTNAAPSESGNPMDRDLGKGLITHYHPMLIDLKNLEIPVITSINGVAAGAGCSLGIIGDLIFASDKSYFYQAFKFIGLVPDAGSTYILPRKIGMARAIELSMLGEKISAEKALSWGLINFVYSHNNLMQETMKTATEIANGPTVAYKLMRKLYWESLGNDFESQLNAESKAQTIAGKTEDCFNGVMSFLQKKKATFKGK